MSHSSGKTTTSDELHNVIVDMFRPFATEKKLVVHHCPNQCMRPVLVDIFVGPCPYCKEIVS